MSRSRVVTRVKDDVARDLEEMGLAPNFKAVYFLSNPIAVWVLLLRMCEACKSGGSLARVAYPFFRLLFARQSLRCGFDIPLFVFAPGLSIAHTGTIVVNGNARVGPGCRIHPGVTIGAIDGKAPVLGRGVFIGPNAGIYGGISVGNGAQIGPHALVIRDVPALAVLVSAPATRLR